VADSPGSSREGHGGSPIRITDDISIDLGPNEEIVGVEILDASEHYDFKKEKPEIILENIMVA
jgi:uncharacterized protein YuzE